MEGQIRISGFGYKHKVCFNHSLGGIDKILIGYKRIKLKMSFLKNDQNRHYLGIMIKDSDSAKLYMFLTTVVFNQNYMLTFLNSFHNSHRGVKNLSILTHLLFNILSAVYA